MAMDPANTLPAMPRMSTELQNLGETQQPQNTDEANLLDFVVVRDNQAVDRRDQDFGDFLNQSQQVTELRAQQQQGVVFDPVAEIEKQMTLQGPTSQGEDPI